LSAADVAAPERECGHCEAIHVALAAIAAFGSRIHERKLAHEADLQRGPFPTDNRAKRSITQLSFLVQFGEWLFAFLIVSRLVIGVLHLSIW
jgi:hypothetical protein